MFDLNGGSGRDVTLREVWAEYQLIRKLKPKTKKLYAYHLNNYLSDWLEKPVLAISKQDVLMRHKELSQRFSGIHSNTTMRVARAIIEFALHRYDGIPSNPVRVLSGLKAWNQEHKRDTYISDDQLLAWRNAIRKHCNETVADYLEFLVLTGLRRSEAANIEWSNVNLIDGHFRIFDTKNGEDHWLPLSSYILTMLEKRRKQQPLLFSIFVFSGLTGERPLCLNYHDFEKISWDTGIKFAPHDLRRTFITAGDALDIPLHVIKRLANHKQADITLRYVSKKNVERLRKPIELINQHIIQHWVD